VVEVVSPVLVTGAGGLLGGQVAWTFAQAGADVYAFTHAQLDITDARTVHDVVRNTRPALIVHTAAMTNVDACEQEPDRAFAVNEEGSRNVASAAADVGAEIVAISTDYVFDGERAPYVEDDPTNPIQVYGRSKLAGERAVHDATDHHYLLRSAWIYGPGGKNFLSKLPELAKTRTSITAVTDQRGSPTYAPDLASSIVAVAGSGKHGVYHVVNEGSCSFAEFCEYGAGILGGDLEVENVTLADLGRPAPTPPHTSHVGAGWARASFAPLRHWREAAKAFLGEAGSA
jgi:dTDP-4-dehydrorhamnose reductase